MALHGLAMVLFHPTPGWCGQYLYMEHRECVDGEMGWDIYMAVLGWHLFYLADEYFGKLAPIKLC